MNCCGKSKFVKYIWVLIGLFILVAVIFSLASCSKKEKAQLAQVNKASTEGKEILYYTCGMHPQVRVSPEEYKRGKTNCPICNMKLTPVYREEAKTEDGAAYYGCGMKGEEHVFLIKDEQLKNCPICGLPLKKLSKEEADKLKGVVGRVKIEGKQLQLAAVKTEPARKLHLFKEVRTVGRIAYDPKLAIAQEEFISTLRSHDRISQGGIKEIIRRSEELAESSRKKLRLLGMSQEQIAELQNSRAVQTNLILPERKAWVYADIYEFELGWIKEGQQARVTTSAFPGEEFKGKIVSINPTLDPKTRSVRIRLEIDNPQMKLKPDMYVDVLIESMYTSAEGSHKVLAVPREAVLDTGLRKLVWVDLGNGEFQGREVKVGPEATSEIDGKLRRYLPILSGLNEAELVVTKGNFLIDSQSQLTGGAAGAYGGALEAEEGAAPAVHQH